VKDLKENGKLLMAGPIAQDGMFIIKASSLEEATDIANKEPFNVFGWRTNRVVPWQIKFGTLSLHCCYLNDSLILNLKQELRQFLAPSAKPFTISH